MTEDIESDDFFLAEQAFVSGDTAACREAQRENKTGTAEDWERRIYPRRRRHHPRTTGDSGIQSEAAE